MLKYLFLLIFMFVCFSSGFAQSEGSSVYTVVTKAGTIVEASVHSHKHEHEHEHEHESGHKHEHCETKTHLSVHGDLLFNSEKNADGESENSIEIRELEFELQHRFSEKLKADVFASLVREDGVYRIDLEEAYLTFNTAGDRLRARAGQILLPFGKVNQIHQHALPYADKPLVIESFFGEEGLKGVGAEVNGKISLGNKTDLKLTAASVKGMESPSFEENEKLLYFARVGLKTKLSDNSNIEAGYSYITGFNDIDAFYKTNVKGIDLTYKLEKEGVFRALMLRGEYLWSQRFLPDGNIDAKGYYIFGQYRLNKDWYLGGRYDYSELPDDNNLNQKSYSAILTYYPTEYCYYRLQYKNILSNFEPRKNQFMFQINFLLGTHNDSDHDDSHDF